MYVQLRLRCSGSWLNALWCCCDATLVETVVVIGFKVDAVASEFNLNVEKKIQTMSFDWNLR